MQELLTLLHCKNGMVGRIIGIWYLVGWQELIGMIGFYSRLVGWEELIGMMGLYTRFGRIWQEFWDWQGWFVVGFYILRISITSSCRRCQQNQQTKYNYLSLIRICTTTTTLTTTTTTTTTQTTVERRRRELLTLLTDAD